MRDGIEVELDFGYELFKMFIRKFEDSCMVFLLQWCPFSSLCFVTFPISIASLLVLPAPVNKTNLGCILKFPFLSSIDYPVRIGTQLKKSGF